MTENVTNQTQEQNYFIAGAIVNGEGDYKIPDEGLYEAVMCGITIRNFRKYQSEDVEPKLQMIFQFDVDGEMHYARTQPFKNVNNEKSTMVKLLSGWLKLTQEKIAGIDLTRLIGQPAQILIKHEQRDQKTYVVLDTVMGARKGQNTPVKPDELPPFLTDKTLSYRLAAGMTIKAGTESVEERSKQVGKPEEDDDDIIF